MGKEKKGWWRRWRWRQRKGKKKKRPGEEEEKAQAKRAHYFLEVKTNFRHQIARTMASVRSPLFSAARMVSGLTDVV